MRYTQISERIHLNSLPDPVPFESVLLYLRSTYYLLSIKKARRFLLTKRRRERRHDYNKSVIETKQSINNKLKLTYVTTLFFFPFALSETHVKKRNKNVNKTHRLWWWFLFWPTAQSLGSNTTDWTCRRSSVGAAIVGECLLIPRRLTVVMVTRFVKRKWPEAHATHCYLNVLFVHLSLNLLLTGSTWRALSAPQPKNWLQTHDLLE